MPFDIRMLIAPGARLPEVARYAKPHWPSGNCAANWFQFSDLPQQRRVVHGGKYRLVAVRVLLDGSNLNPNQTVSGEKQVQIEVGRNCKSIRRHWKSELGRRFCAHRVAFIRLPLSFAPDSGCGEKTKSSNDPQM
jgi:hypothetical protein